MTYKTNDTTRVVSISSASVAAPVTSLTGDFMDANVDVYRVATAGGVSLTTLTPNVATTGGSLQITNLNVDQRSQKVFADLIGGNNVGARSNVHLWDVAAISGSTSLDLSGWQLDVYNTATATSVLSGLSINRDAFDLIAQSLGLTPLGITALQVVTDFGVIASTVTVSHLPEPESSALMGLGLVGIGLSARRRRAR